MYRKTPLPELLAPAGDMECLYAAVAAGADAIYVGGKRFGARAFAKNFELEELSQAVNYCHLHGVKLYVTLNTLIEDREMPSALEYAAELYRIGVDALIAADVGVISAIRRHIPDLEIHASTQLSAHSTLGVDAAVEMGAARAVVARELSLSDIKTVVERSKCEIEVFLHGALCVCHSGQCLFSSMVGGRSGNRGECAQPCRLPYGKGYPLSLKDLSLADHIPELIESGVASLKIEGRMKAPSYVYTVTSIYRRLLDESRAATPAENDQLRRAFSRDGFTDGYFRGKLESGMTGIRTAENKEDSRTLSDLEIARKRLPVRAKVVIKLGEPARMTLTDGNKTVSVLGATPALAENSPLNSASVKERLSKMGNTSLSLSTDDIDLTIDEVINLPPSAINALRRDAAAAFESSGRELGEVKYQPAPYKRREKPLTSAQFFSEKAFLDAKKRDEQLLSTFDVVFLPLFSSNATLSMVNGVFIPPVAFDSEIEEISSALKNAKNQGVMYALVGNIGQISLALASGLVPIGDFRLNITNGESARVYAEMGVESFILSPELTLPKARDIGGGLITYGRIPLMITERCYMKDCFGCKSCSSCSLTDRKGERFPMMREFRHRNLIFNSVVTYMGDRAEELKSFGIRSRHFLFTTEGGDEICSVIRAYKKGSPPSSAKIRRVGRR